MFPFKGQNELVFGNPSTDDHDSMYNQVDQDLVIMDDQYGVAPSGNMISFASSSNIMTSNKTEKKRSGSARSGPSDRDSEMKKAMHRDLERKRRQEMSQLYDSLRSLLPQEQLKGKHSISDLMNIAVDYTKRLEKNVKESGIRRDKLRKQSTSSSNNRNASNNSPNHVVVSQLQDGIEILINTGSEFELSRVLMELLARELNVVNCVSTKSSDGSFLYKILAQANDSTVFIDVSMLQGRLTEVVNL